VIRKLNIKSLSAKNFMCFGKEGIEIDLTKLGNIVLIKGVNKDAKGDARNGVGKSSVADIIAYTFFGQTIKPKLNLDDVINNKTKKKLRTEVQWDNYKVVRERKPNHLFLYEFDAKANDWKDISTGGMPAVQKQIEDLIGINFETFVNLMVFTDNNSGSFLECDRDGKRKIVENLLSLEKYRNYWDKSKKVRNQAKDKLKTMSETYDRLLKELEHCKARVESTRQQEDNWKKLKTGELKSLLIKIKAKREELESTDLGAALVEYQQAQDRIKAINDTIPESEDKEIKARAILEVANEKLELLREQKVKLSSNAQNLQSSLVAARDEAKKAKQTIDSLKAKKGTKCPTCYGVVKEENFKHVTDSCNSTIEEKEKDVARIEYDLVEAKGKIVKCDEQIERVRKAVTEKDVIIREHSVKMAKYRTELLRLNALAKPEVSAVEKVLEEQIAELKRQALAKDKEIKSPSPYVQVLVDAEIDVSKKQKECDDQKAAMVKYEKELPYYEFWVDAFGDNGIRKFIVDGIIPALNAKIAYWLQFLIDGNIQLSFNEELKETIERNPSDGDPFVYYAMSGGERRRLNLAVSQAFAHVMMLNSGACPSLVFLDEVTTNIDPIGVQGVHNMIVELSKEKQVFVTTHDHDLIELLMGVQVINLVKQGGNTVVV
jgi:DNA repair exonuclease SbcCD ATPase subunit